MNVNGTERDRTKRNETKRNENKRNKTKGTYFDRATRGQSAHDVLQGVDK